MLTCLYHPVNEFRVVKDEEVEDMLATGVWFRHPTEAQNMRQEYEQRLHDEKRKGSSDRKQKTRNGRIATQCE